MSENNFEIKLQAVLEKIKSITNIKADIKAIESKLSKIKLQGTLLKTTTQKEVNSKLKSIKTNKIKIDADTTQVEKKIKKIGKQKTDTTITPKVDNTQVVSGLKQAQKETKTLWERFTSGISGINLIQMGVQKVVQAIHEAIAGIKELDKIKTNIQMVSGTSDSDVNAMMSSYNVMAKELSSTTKDVASAANEFLRMGESIETTNELIRSSQVLSKVGMIESTEAASYLISSLKGYQVAAEDSMDIVSKLTSVDLEAAVSAGGLAEALSKCANIASNSGVTMDRLIGYTATVGETTQKSMSEVGNSFQALLSRMNNIKIGRFIDDETGESLSDTEAVLNKLGIQLRDTENTYRSFDDVLDDVGSRWESFTKVEQNALSVAIAGTRQRENFEALMNNWGNALNYSETAANSAGSALERYGVYQDSIEAKTNELTAAMESLSTNMISEELYSGIIEATTGLVEFLDKTNLLKSTLAGIMVMGISKTFVSIATGFITAAKSTAQLSAAMKLFDNGKSVDNLRSIGAACKGLSEKQLKLVLSTKGLINEDRKLILEGMGVKEQERQQTLTTLGFAAAEDKATISTFSLKGALNALSVAYASNPIGFILTGITTAVSIATTVISKHNQKLEEMRDRVNKATDSAKSFSQAIKDIQKDTVDMEKSVDSIIDRYAKLSQGVNSFTNENKSLSTDEYEEFLDLNKQLARLFPSLTRNYDENSNAILGLSGSVDSVTESIKALVEQEKELAKGKIRENLEQYFNGTDEADGAWKALEGKKKALEEINSEQEKLTNAYNTLINSNKRINLGNFSESRIDYEKEKYLEYFEDNFGKDIAKAVEKAILFENTYDRYGDLDISDIYGDLVVDFSQLELTEKQKEQITSSYDTFYNELSAEQKTAMSELDLQNSEFSNNAMLWLEDLAFYKDSNKYVQLAMQNLVRSIDWSNYDAEQLDYDGVKRIIQDSVLTPFQVACDNPDTKKS